MLPMHPDTPAYEPAVTAALETMIQVLELEENLEVGHEVPTTIEAIISLVAEEMTEKRPESPLPQASTNKLRDLIPTKQPTYPRRVPYSVRELAVLWALRAKMGVRVLKELQGNVVFFAGPSEQPTLMFPAMTGDLEVAALIMRRVGNNKTFINAQDLTGTTALHMAVWYGNAPMVSFLINCGANINIETHKKETALYLAALIGKLDCVQRLLKCKEVRIDAVDYEGSTPLHGAAHGGHEAIVALLIASGANRHIKTPEQETALDFATRQGNLGCVQLLLQGPLTEKMIIASVMKAIQFNQGVVLKYFLDLQYDTVVTPEGNLESRVFNVNALFVEGRYTLLQYAVHCKQPDMVHLLLAYSAKPWLLSICDGSILDCSIPLHAIKNPCILADNLCLAALYGENAFITLILKYYPVLVNCYNQFGVMPLHYAAQSDNPETVKLLLAAGANVNVVDRDGYTVLHYAVENKELEVARVLLAADATKLNLCVPEMLTHYKPIQFAKARGNYSLATCLEEVCPGQESNLRPVP